MPIEGGLRILSEIKAEAKSIGREMIQARNDPQNYVINILIEQILKKPHENILSPEGYIGGLRGIKNRPYWDLLTMYWKHIVKNPNEIPNYLNPIYLEATRRVVMHNAYTALVAPFCYYQQRENMIHLEKWDDSTLDLLTVISPYAEAPIMIKELGYIERNLTNVQLSAELLNSCSIWVTYSIAQNIHLIGQELQDQTRIRELATGAFVNFFVESKQENRSSYLDICRIIDEVSSLITGVRIVKQSR